MSGAADQVFILLDGVTEEVIERLLDVGDHTMLMALHLAEQRGRARPKVLAAIESRGLEIEKELPPPEAEREPTPLERAVAQALVEADRGRPESRAMRDDLTEDDRYPVPREDDFVDPNTGRQWDFMGAPDLETIGAHLFATQPIYLRDAKDWRIRYLWQREGKQSKGKERHGYVKKLSGELRYYAGVEFIVVISAEYTRNWTYTLRQMRALVFHELLHIGMTEKYSPTTNPHDAEVFFPEMKVFGLWRDDLQRLNEQLGLPF